MSSLAPGKNTSDVEVTNISAHGVWILVRGKELFMSYEDFPWFKDQAAKKVSNVEEQSRNHFHWPDLDIDLTMEIIKNPGHFPLKANTG